jgi:hypothetical protein
VAVFQALGEFPVMRLTLTADNRIVGGAMRTSSTVLVYYPVIYF